MQHRLHVEREEEEHRQEAGHGDHLRGVGDGDAPDAEDRHRDERVGDAPLVDEEGDERQSGDGELRDRAGRAPADIGRLHEGVDEQQHPAGDEQGAERVEAPRPGSHPLLLEQCEGAGEGDQAERDVDEQHPAPAGPFGEQSAEADACGAADPRDCCPDAERGVAVTGGTERAREARERRR